MRYNPLVSILLPVYNTENYIRYSIDSIIQQTYGNIELIIIDDASTDSTPEILSCYSDLDSIRVIQNECNIGIAPSLNKGAQEAEGEIIARQDADDISHPNRIAKQVQILEDQSVAGVGTNTIVIDETGSCLFKKSRPSKPSFSELLKKNRFTHGSMAIRREVFEKFDGYDERFVNAQDYDLWLRVANEHEMRNTKQYYYYLRYHTNNASFSGTKPVMYAYLARAIAMGEVDRNLLAQPNLNNIIPEIFSPKMQRDYYFALLKQGLRESNQELVQSYLSHISPKCVPYQVCNIAARLIASIIPSGVVKMMYRRFLL